MSAFWHIADVPLALTNVCFEGKTRTWRGGAALERLFGTSCRWPSPAAGCIPWSFPRASLDLQMWKSRGGKLL